VSSLEETLEIPLVTYNRAHYLERALGQLLESPFSGCRITVLDNHSTDATPEVCERYRARFPRMRVIRHARNVGAGPNLLRAVELSEAPYTWILADDDTFDWSECGDVIEALRAGRVDLVSVGAPGQQDWERGLEAGAHELVERGARFFHAYTFVPATIFRTELFDSNLVAEGYRNVSNLYPHFPFVRTAVERDWRVYTSRRELVVRNVENATGGLDWFRAWAACCETISDPALRRRALFEVEETRAQWLLRLAVALAYEKMLSPRTWRRELREMAFRFDLEQRLMLALVLPLALVPGALYERALPLIRRLSRREIEGPITRDDALRT